MSSFNNIESNPNSSSSGGLEVALPGSGLLNEEQFWWVMGFVLGLDFVVAVFASGSNILTIIVYHRLGYNDTTNISLTALAVSDLGVAFTTFICVLALLLPLIPNAPFTYEAFMTAGPTPHNFFARVSALITTYLSVERFLCVFSPLKIKSIFTPRRTVIAMVVIFVPMFCLYPIGILRFPIGWVYIPYLNKTLLGILPVSDPTTHTLHGILMTYISFVLPILTFVVIIVTTILLSLTLERSKRWRDANKSMALKSTASTSKSNDGGASSAASESTKETRAVKMVIAITTVFILSFIPSCVHMLAQVLIPEFNAGRRYNNLFAVTGMVFLLVNCINCSANVIIYYNMSSKFRLALQNLTKKYI